MWAAERRPTVAHTLLQTMERHCPTNFRVMGYYNHCLLARVRVTHLIVFDSYASESPLIHTSTLG